MATERGADWLTVAEARARVMGDVAPLEAVTRSLADALGHVLAEELISPLDLPPWDNSGMDGFAVRSADVLGASPESPRGLRVLEDVPAGRFPSRAVEPGTATRVMTGAPVPAGADSVVRVEHTDGGSALGTERAAVRVFSDLDAGRNIRGRGEDLRRGARVLDPGTVVRAAQVGVAASLGRGELRVVRRPKVAVLTSGDELVEVERFDEVLAGRRIVSSNSYSLAAQIAESGCEARLLGIAADDPRSLRDHLERARGCDALVTSAGISVGAHDHTRAVMEELGTRVAFWRVRMRPGSPFAYGRVDGLGGIPWFGLPGNPVSSMVTFEIFVRPALLRMAGHRALFPPTTRARLMDGYPARAGLTHFARVRLEEQAGEPVARLTGGQGSGILTSMAAADGLAVIPDDRDGAAAGDLVTTLLLNAAPLREEPGY